MPSVYADCVCFCGCSPQGISNGGAEIYTLNSKSCHGAISSARTLHARSKHPQACDECGCGHSTRYLLGLVHRLRAVYAEYDVLARQFLQACRC